MKEYLDILIFILFATGLSVVIVAASYILGSQNPDSEKVSVYECGFDPYGDSRNQFEIRFFFSRYLIHYF
jgi:NADH-quinone oxidoreductase subunit A